MDLSNIRFEISGEMNESEHVQHEAELIYVLKGQAVLLIGGEEQRIEREGILLINMGRKHALRLEEGAMTARIWIPAGVLRKYLETDLILFSCNSMLGDNDDYQHLREIMYKICGMMAEGPEKDFYRWGLYCQLIGYLLEHFRVESDGGNDMEESIRVYRILNYIYEHFSEDISLNEMAASLYLSTGYASRYFKKTFGMNFKDYINQVRLQHAVGELAGSNKSITRIAIDNGFANASVFNRKFTQKYGMSPTQYRKSADVETEDSGPAVDRMDHAIRELIEKAEKAAADDLKGTRQQIRVPVGRGTEAPLPRTWQQIINIGPASDILQAELQNHIRIMQKNLHFRYARFWNIFSDSMRIQERPDEEKYNFHRLDMVIDFLLDTGMKPFFNLGSRPKRIFQTVFRAVDIIEESEMVRSLEEYGALLRQFLRHIIDRYSAEEVQTWKFEIWNNENQVWKNGKISFFKYFSYLYGIIKSELPEIQTGGFGLPIDQYQDMLCRWKKESCQLDFLTFYCFPYRRYMENDKIVTRYCTQDQFLLQSVRELKSFLKKEGYRELPVYFTEWNSTISSRSYANDSCWKGAYIIKNVTEILGMVDGIGYWILSDFYADSADCRGILNGGPGLLTREGYAKPACYAFNFLGRLGREQILRGKNYLISRSGKNRYEMICHNYIKFDYQYYLKEEYEIPPEQLRGYYGSEEKAVLCFQLQGIDNGNYTLRMHRVNEHSGSILDEWICLDCEEELSRDEVRYIKQKSGPSLYKKKYAVSQNMLEFDVQMDPQEVCMIQIEKNEE